MTGRRTFLRSVLTAVAAVAIDVLPRFGTAEASILEPSPRVLTEADIIGFLEQIRSEGTRPRRLIVGREFYEKYVKTGLV